MRYGQDFVSTSMWFMLSLGCIAGVYQGLMRLTRLDNAAFNEKKYCEVSLRCVGAACVVGAMWVCGVTLKVDKVRKEMVPGEELRKDWEQLLQGCVLRKGWEQLLQGCVLRKGWEQLLQGITVCKDWERNPWETTTSMWLTIHIILLSIMVACLLAASVMDVETYMIYNYVWWLGAGTGILMMLLCDNRMWRSMLLFFVIQECFFSKMYGRADCHGFVVCSMAEAAFGMGMREYLLHMLIAFGIMGIVQLLRRNIGRNGNLKEPIPFLPYITVAFGVNLIAYLCV